jgi:multidrug resistance protein, MATE family
MTTSAVNLGEVVTPRSALAEVWSIAWPTVLAMSSYTLMQFVDRLMVGQVSATALAAQGNGGLWTFAMTSFPVGVMTVVNTYVSQNLGAGTPQNGPRYAWAAMWFTLLIWLTVLVPYGFALPWIFDQMVGHSDELREMETAYAQILVFGSLIVLGARGINQFFFGMHRPGVVTMGALAGNVVNLTLNYVLIFGDEGIPTLGLPGAPGVPPMGVAGAAIATVIGTAVEMIIPLAVFLGPRMNAAYQTRRQWRFDRERLGELIRVGWPAGLQWGNELICWAIFMGVFIGYYGEAHLSASTIAFGYMGLSFMPALGFSVAANSLVGKYVGAGKPEVGAHRAHLALLVAMVYMTVCGAVFFVLREPLIEIFLGAAVTEAHALQQREIVRIGAVILICVAFFQTADAVGVIYSGALRGAGDTTWPGVLTLIYSWVFIIGMGGLLMWWMPQWESLGPWLAASVYIILYGLTMAVRFERGRWKSIRLVARGPATA